MPKELGPEGKRTRVQVDISPESLSRIDEKRKSLGLTRAAFFHNAIRVHEYFVTKAGQGQDLKLTPADLRVVLGLPQNLESI